MANVLYLNCETTTPNTGVARCNVDLGLLQGMIFVPKGTRWTRSQFATLPSILATAAQTAIPSLRVFPVGPFVDFADNSTDSVKETTDYGFGAIVRDGTFIWRGRTGYGGLCLYRGLRKLNDKQDYYDVLYIFKKGILLTYVPNASTGAQEAKGVAPSLIETPNWKIAQGSAATQYWIETQVFDATQLTDNFLFIQTDTSALNTVSGISDVDLQNDAVWNSSPAGSIDILPVVGCDGSSLVTTYGSTWNSASLWSATETSTGNAITITGVSIVNGKYRIQLDTTDTDYPAVGEQATISGAAVSVLNAAGIEGYETNSVTVTRP